MDQLKEILDYIDQCDKEFLEGNFNPEKLKRLNAYLIKLEKLNGNNIAMYRAVLEKLKFIKKQISSYPTNTNKEKEDALLNLVPLSVTNYIIKLIEERHLTNVLEIARFAYIELSKCLYYDISYVRFKQLKCDEERKILVNTKIDCKKAKIFSYVLCTQYLDLYSYILSKFSIKVRKITRPTTEHVWGEIDLPNDKIAIVDATEYIGSSIDLSNAKSVSRTKGFLIIPKEYKGLRLAELNNNEKYQELKEKLTPYYEECRELDKTLGYIKDDYEVNKILKENELFQRPDEIIRSTQEFQKYIQMTQTFFKDLKIPDNIDGYEIYAYYHFFTEKLPQNIKENVILKTLFVDTYEYKQKRIKSKFLTAPEEYIKYLDDLVYRRYLKYLKNPTYETIFEKIKDGTLKSEELSELIVKKELEIAQINRRLNPYYAVNELILYNPFDMDKSIHHIYEPMVGRKLLKDEESYRYKEDNNIISFR